ncbi:MAG: HAMP domain-containing histidine kinase [Ferruginibacter sp.]|nr:HAMP domain-containing histidine kinase [Chitinophagaceae bacterium]
METLLQYKELRGEKQGFSLHTLVSRLVACVVPATARNKSFMVNDIPAGLSIAANPGLVTAVLSNLFNTVALHSVNSCIRISAKVYSNIILVQVRDHHSANACTIAYSLQPAQPLAEKIGGYLGITSQWKNETTIVFSFPNIPLAA